MWSDCIVVKCKSSISPFLGSPDMPVVVGRSEGRISCPLSFELSTDFAYEQYMWPFVSTVVMLPWNVSWWLLLIVIKFEVYSVWIKCRRLSMELPYKIKENGGNKNDIYGTNRYNFGAAVCIDLSQWSVSIINAVVCKFVEFLCYYCVLMMFVPVSNIFDFTGIACGWQ
jgi:hypothetical protein